VRARFLCPVPTLASRFYAPSLLPDSRPGVAHLGSWFWQQASVSVLYLFSAHAPVKVRCSCLLRVSVLEWRGLFCFLFKALWCLRESSQLEKQKQIKKLRLTQLSCCLIFCWAPAGFQLTVFVACAGLNSGLSLIWVGYRFLLVLCVDCCRNLSQSYF
jgi:hypothetical protein